MSLSDLSQTAIRTSQSSSIPPSSPRRPWQPPAPEDLQPELPQYEITGLLGRGGMGAVYRARQKSLKREVAIKVLPPTIEENDMRFAERFQSEAESMARLNHPGIVSVFDAGETPGGLLYIVMEYVEGTDVAQMIATAGKLPPDHAHAIAAHVCDALEYAHANGLIHRDIKPANIMVDTQGRVKVADFGLAKTTNEESGFTQSNMAVGTPDFVAPEAFIPGLAVDGRADLYAVGVMLYQMLTGEIPRGAWHPPSVRVPGIDRRFDQIVIKAMQTDRESRHNTATEMRQHLDTLLTASIPVPDLQRYSSNVMVKNMPPPSPAPVSGQSPRHTESRQASTRIAPAFSSPATPKSKMPLLFGLGAAAAVAAGAFFISSPKKTEATTAPSTANIPAPTGSISGAALGGLQSAPAPADKLNKKDGAPSITTTPAPVPAKSPVTESPSPDQSSDAIAPFTRVAKAQIAPMAAPVLPVEPALVADAPASARSNPAYPPELATLDTQFLKLQAERVTAPFQADVTKLNTGYLGGITKKIAEEKAAGHLNGIIALEAEQKLIEEGSSLPDEDSADIPASLKGLRAIYREQIAKLDAQRQASMRTLTEPLDKRLVQMEMQLTKTDRIAEAKVVRTYRETLEQSIPVATDSTATGTAMVAATSPTSFGSKPSAHSTTAVVPLDLATAAALKNAISNSLGMKFVPVPGTNILICIHETRYKDYASYAAKSKDVSPSWKNQALDGVTLDGRPDDYPVVGLNWDDAQGFCAWLSKKEGKIYRLPTDKEWSYAVGIGKEENWGDKVTPEMLSNKVPDEFPWGNKWPPAKDAGNFADMSRKEKASTPGVKFIEDYTDGFATIAPVMSFKPNKLGIYDLGGNVWEWVEDWWNGDQKERVRRGASFNNADRNSFLSSSRDHLPPTVRGTSGFRCAIVVKPN